MDHEAFIETVATGAQLDREAAQRATQATLQTLAERIAPGEARDVATRVPPELAPWVATTTPAERFDADEFVRRVAERVGVDAGTAFGRVRAVFDALVRAVGQDELADIAAELSEDFATLLPRGRYVEVVALDCFLAAVARHAGIDEQAARSATEAVLETLAERIAGGEVRDLKARLPIELHPALDRGVRRSGGQAPRMTPEQFLRRIAEREGVPPALARPHARAVLAALRETVGDEEYFDVTVQLPRDLVAAIS